MVALLNGKPLLPHFVAYDYDNPSPLFFPEQVELIEWARNDFSGEDLERIHRIETWVLNVNTGLLNSPAIPGLRPPTVIDCRYVKRVTAERFPKNMFSFVELTKKAFAPDELPGYMPAFRVKLPNGDLFYPIVFHGDLNKITTILEQTAVAAGTQLGRFDRGQFVVDGATSYPFSVLEFDELLNVKAPKGW